MLLSCTYVLYWMFSYCNHAIVFLILLLADNLMSKAFTTAPDIGHQMESFLATGNLRSRSGLGLQQVRAACTWCWNYSYGEVLQIRLITNTCNSHNPHLTHSCMHVCSIVACVYAQLACVEAQRQQHHPSLRLYMCEVGCSECMYRLDIRLIARYSKAEFRSEYLTSRTEIHLGTTGRQ